MKLLTTLFFTSAALTLHAANAQTTARAIHSPTARIAASGCVKEPDLSPKIPALPSTAGCAKHLYTIIVTPPVKLENVSPLEGPSLREVLKIDEPSAFSLDYIDIKPGSGQLAGPHEWYSIHYTGYLLDGTKFDSSYDHPDHAPFVVNIDHPQVIPGWYTGFGGMRVGGKRRLFIPYQLAYGPQGKPAPEGQQGIPPRAELIFDVELVAVSATDPAAPPASATKPPTTPSAAPQPSAPATTQPTVTPPAPAQPAAPAATQAAPTPKTQ